MELNRLITKHLFNLIFISFLFTKAVLDSFKGFELQHRIFTICKAGDYQASISYEDEPNGNFIKKQKKT